MKGLFWENMDIDLYLEPGELEELKHHILQTQLIWGHKREPVNKNLILRYGENNGTDGFDFKKIEDNKKRGWESILGYEVTINQWAYEHIIRQGHFGTRYDGENKITINDRKPPF